MPRSEPELSGSRGVFAKVSKRAFVRTAGATLQEGYLEPVVEVTRVCFYTVTDAHPEFDRWLPGRSLIALMRPVQQTRPWAKLRPGESETVKV